ncbi:unnamed protein product [Prorocentrum cordatum]|uniref:Uncharacterized protein n=1 Tax=Prorocentrum cordatum TaxID=2364126 RepID=A0ABN9TVQ6_9DINO|nr:unnamed protein product [Polarella glacialis]
MPRADERIGRARAAGMGAPAHGTPARKPCAAGSPPRGCSPRPGGREKKAGGEEGLEGGKGAALGATRAGRQRRHERRRSQARPRGGAGSARRAPPEASVPAPRLRGCSRQQVGPGLSGTAAAAS